MGLDAVTAVADVGFAAAFPAKLAPYSFCRSYWHDGGSHTRRYCVAFQRRSGFGVGRLSGPARAASWPLWGCYFRRSQAGRFATSLCELRAHHDICIDCVAQGADSGTSSASCGNKNHAATPAARRPDRDRGVICGAQRAASSATDGAEARRAPRAQLLFPRKERPASKARRSAGGSAVSPSFLRSE